MNRENWFGMIYSWADSKKKSNLMLSIFKPGMCYLIFCITTNVCTSTVKREKLAAIIFGCFENITI